MSQVSGFPRQNGQDLLACSECAQIRALAARCPPKSLSDESRNKRNRVCRKFDECTMVPMAKLNGPICSGLVFEKRVSKMGDLCGGT